MWAESDEELEGRAGFGSKKQGKGDMSRPVSFVSGGLKKSSAEMEEEEVCSCISFVSPYCI